MSLGVMYGTIGAVYSFFLTPLIVLYSLIFWLRRKIKVNPWAIWPAVSFSLICLIGLITSFDPRIYIYTEVISFLAIPALLRGYDTIRFMVNVQFLFILVVTIIGIISTTFILSQYGWSVADMKTGSADWMRVFVLYGNLNGLFYAYGILLPVYIFFLDDSYRKLRVFMFLAMPFLVLNIISGWHGKGILVSYGLGVLFIILIRYPLIFSAILFMFIFTFMGFNIYFTESLNSAILSDRGVEYMQLISGDNRENISTESLYVRIYDLYGILPSISSLVLVGSCLLVGLKAYLFLANSRADAWLLVFFIFSLFVTSFFSTNLFAFYVPSIFVSWSFFFYVVNLKRFKVSNSNNLVF